MNYNMKSYITVILIVVLTALLSGCTANITKLQSDVNENATVTPFEALDMPLTPSEALDGNEIQSSTVMKEDELIISRYNGRIGTINGLVLYDIITKQVAEHLYTIDLTFYDYDSKEQLQQFTYPLRDDFMPETVSKPIQIEDVNNDGSYDLILDLGIYGKIKLALCYVYDPDQKSYVQVAGFDQLMTPSYQGGYILEDWRNDPTEYAKNKYQVIGNELELVASLHATYGGHPNPVYTEKVLIDGKMVSIKENVSAKEIDASEWNYSLP